MRQLVEDASLREREGAPRESLVQQADLARVEAIEAPNRVDASAEIHGRMLRRMIDCVKD